MLRIRSDGGALTGRAAARHRRDQPRSSPATPPTSPTGRTSSCTGSASRTSPRSGERLEAVGLMTTEACGDTPRVILGSPVAGIAADEIIDGTPGARGDPRAATSATPEFSNLPRKFKTADLRLAAASTSPTRSTTSRSSASSTPSSGPGFDVWVGGGLSTNPMFAQRLGAWVPLEEVARGLGRRRRRSSATTATAGCATGPA